MRAPIRPYRTHPPILLGFAVLAACDDAGTASPSSEFGSCEPCACESDGATPSIGETPPLPGDACAEPPGPQGTLIETTIGSGQAAQAATAAELMDPERITVVMCGTGGPLPSDRAQACTAVFANGRFLLFDAGDRAEPSMEDLGLPVADITAVFLTHFHSAQAIHQATA